MAQNQLNACDDGMLGFPPRPTKTVTSAKVKKGRGRPIVSFNILAKTESPSQSPSNNMTPHNRPRAPPLHISHPKIAIMITGSKGGLLSFGINQSKTGLLSDELINLNTDISNDWSQ